MTTLMTTPRAQPDTARHCGMPTRAGTPCQQKIPADAEACAHHSKQAERARSEAKARFLAEFDGTWGEADAAAQRAGISRTMAYVWRDSDPEFRRDWDRLRVENAAAYKETLAERFFVGTLKPVIHQGRITDWYREVDNSIGKFMLKALDARYSDRVDVSVNVERDPEAEQVLAQVMAEAGGLAALQAAIDDVVDAEIVEDEGTK